MISFGLDNDAAGIADAKFRSDERAGHIHCVAKENSCPFPDQRPDSSEPLPRYVVLK